MNEAIAWAITMLVVLLLGSFAAAVVAVLRQPASERPRTPSYNRLGQQIGATENPDFHVNPGEIQADEPDVRPASGGSVPPMPP